MKNNPENNHEIAPGTPEKIKLAATMLAAGRLVAIPTETVYGLAANALDKYAVARVFEAKGRERHKPLVIFVHDLKTAKKLAHFTPLALKLAKKYWPGALTLVLAKVSGCPLPLLVSEGRSSLAIRIPNHPVALALLKTSHLPLVVTSANRSGQSSPTSAKGVAEDLAGKVDLILDGGSCEIGRESTVLDVSAEVAVILRSGALSKKTLEAFLKVRVDEARS